MAVSMDQLTASLDARCDVASNPFDTNRPHPRFSEYSSLREPARLLGDQNKRRAEFLERQKSKREKLVNLQRCLLEDPDIGKDNIEENGSTDNPESEETQSSSAKHIPRSKWTFSNQLMMSEWLVDVPPDFEDNWLAKPCPKGRRMLVVAYQGTTKAYSKAGHIVATFKSVLPAGRNRSRPGITILDCIWNWENRTYFVLDILAWNNTVLLGCETEFRFYWLKTKLEENSEISCASEANRFPFVALPFIKCEEKDLKEMMNCFPMFSKVNDPGLDGMLFYHKSSLYEHGTTPLVTWIKPFMMEEVLGVKVHQNYMEERPTSYFDQAGYIRDFEEAAEAKKASFRGRGFRRNGGKSSKWKQNDNQMDCVDDECNSKMDGVD